MAWGGKRTGAGRKPTGATKSNPATRPQLRAEPKLKASQALTVPAAPKTDSEMPAIDPRAWAMMLPEIEEISKRYAIEKARTPENNPFRLPKFPAKAIPPDPKLTMAMDNALTTNLGFASNEWLSGDVLGGLPAEGLLFLGYTYLAELAQRPEYRVMSETIADDATRKWIDFDVTGDEKKQAEERAKDPEGHDARMADPDERKKRVKAAGKTDKVKELKDDQLRLEVKDRYYEQCRNDGFFGRSHLFHDIRTNDSEEIDPEELKAPIGDSRDQTSKTKVPVGSFKALRTIEPVWTYPMMYNAINPLRKDWYNPQVWYVMGQEIHGTRLQTFIGHPVPDMLKPAYSFGGLSLSQMAKPYVDIWLQTRQSVATLIHSFSVMVLMTDLSTLLQPGNAGALLARVAMFNMLRDNQGTFVVNKNTEDFKNVSASLAGLHELQSQSQEHMASVHRIPLVKFTGIQPAGLNASSEGEIEVYDDTIGAFQGRFMDSNLRRTINFQQLSLWGEIDPEITHRWEPLRAMTLAEKGQKEKDDADRDQKYVDMGAISPGEVRKIIIENPELPYTGLDPDDVPEPPAEEGMIGPGAGGAATEFEKEADGTAGPEKEPGAADAQDPFGATDEWNEDDHPRGQPGNAGQFGSGGGGGGAKQTLKMPQFGLTPTPWQSHQASTWKAPPRGPMPKSSGDAKAATSTVVWAPGSKSDVKALNGKPFKSWRPPADWAGVKGQAEIAEPPVPALPKGMEMASGCIIREPDGRVWLLRPAGGFGGYDQTFPKGRAEEGLSLQANAIKEAYEETGLKVKITGFAGDHGGDTTVSRYYFAERETGDPADAGEESEGVILAPTDSLAGLLNRKRDRDIAAGLASAPKKPLDPAKLKKEGGKLGSNEGGTFTDEEGNKFYIKRPSSKDHVSNELAAARLYQLAGVQTLDYRPVEGGNHVATAWQKLDKKNISDFTPAERKEATKDFAVHAWLSNWDAAGLGGDNQGTLGGKPVTLDVGGSLRYRAQGTPKGAAFGDKVHEIDTLRDKGMNSDAAGLFGKMTEPEMKASVKRVTDIPDDKIRAAIGDDKPLADRLIARKRDMAERFGLIAQDAALALDEAPVLEVGAGLDPIEHEGDLWALDEANFEESKHPRDPDGKFASGGGTSVAGAEPPKGEGEKTFKTKKEHVAHLLLNGTTVADILKVTGWNAISIPPLAKSAGLKLEKYKEGGVTKYKGTPMTDAEKAEVKAPQKIEIKTPAPEPKPVEVKNVPEPPQNYEEFKQHLQKYVESGDGPSVSNLLKYNPSWAAQLKEEKGLTPPKPDYGPPTAAELAKAQKNVKLQLQYVPNAPQTPEAQKLVDKFNNKYEGQVMSSPAELKQKVDDFKDLTAAMVPLMTDIQKKQAEAAQKQQAAAKAEAAKKAADIAKEMNDPAVKEHYEVLSGIGANKQYWTMAEHVIKKHKLAITPQEGAYIQAYVGSHYGPLNSQLRAGVVTVEQWKYAKKLDDALEKMPVYEGTVHRGVSLEPHQFAKYQKAVGKVIPEPGFQSAGVKGKLWGSHTFVINSKTARDIRSFNPGEGGGEVVFKNNTAFMISKIEGDKIYMEEV